MIMKKIVILIILVLIIIGVICLKKDKRENQWTSTKETSCDTGIHLASQDDSKTQPFIFVVKEAY